MLGRFRRTSAVLLSVTICGATLLGSTSAQAQSCDPPKILFVLDASSSMLGDAGGGMSKWTALQDAVSAVFSAHGDAAQFGLMTFPGDAGGCTTGAVDVAIAPGTGGTIESELGTRMIQSDAATPAGQTLAAASSNAELTDPTNPGYVIFMTDGWQFCDIDTSGAPVCATQADCTLMGVGSCPSCNSCVVNSSDPACAGQSGDSCYCVRKWPVEGVKQLSAAGVSTFVVGFGGSTDVVTLNEAGFESGNAPAGCDSTSSSPSCYFQADNPTELTDALADIVAQLVTETCTGDCGIDGTRTCTSSGWTDCDSPDTVSCSNECGTGTQTCANGVLSECDAQCSAGGAGGTGSGGAGAGGSGTGGAGGSGTGGVATGGGAGEPGSSGGEGGSSQSGSGAGAAAGVGGTTGEGSGGSDGGEAGDGGTSSATAGAGTIPPRGDDGASSDDGSCACRSAGSSNRSGAPLFGACALIGLAGLRLRRRR